MKKNIDLLSYEINHDHHRFPMLKSSGTGVDYNVILRWDGDISWTMTFRGHYFSKWATFRGRSQRVTFRGHFW